MTIRRLLFSLGILFVLALAGAAGFLLLLPPLLENSLLPRQAARLGIADFRGRVDRVGPGSALLRGLSVGPPADPGVVVPWLRLDYSLSGLFEGRLERLELIGLQIVAERRQCEFVIPGLEQLFAAAPQEEADQQVPSLPAREVAISQAVLVVKDGGAVFRLPFEMKLEEAADGSSWRGRTVIFLLGQEVRLEAEVDPVTGSLAARFQAAAVDLAALAAIPALPSGLLAGGRLAAEGIVRAQLSPFALIDAEASAVLREGQLLYDSFFIRGNRDRPASFRVKAAENGRKWRLEAKDLDLAAPWPAALQSLLADLSLKEGRLAASGEYTVAFPPGREGEPARLAAPLQMAGSFAVGPKADGGWTFALAGDGGEVEVSLAGFEQGTLSFAPPRLRLSGETRENRLEFLFEAEAKNGRLEGGEYNAAAAGLVLSGTGRLEGEVLAAAFDLRTEKVELLFDAGRLTLPALTMRGEAGRQGPAVNLDGELRIVGATFKAQEVAAAGIGLHLPLVWPPSAPLQGSFAVDTLRWRDRNLGAVNGTIRQQGRDLRFEARHENRLFSGLALQFSGRASLEKEALVELEFQAPAFEARKIDPGLLFPAAAGWLLAGRIQADGRLAANPPWLGGSVLASWRGGSLANTEKGFAMEGIETDLHVIDLPALASGPGQRLRFGSAALGRLSFGAGEVEYQLEEAGTVLIEKSDFSWSGGHVRIYALRISPGADEYDLVLHCDGLRIAGILQQLGLARAEGEGAVSGMIPLTVSGGDLRFGQGYLFSTPGQGGTLKIREAEQLAAGVAGTAHQAGQIEFAVEALRNFEYNWLKFFLATEGEELVLRMQLDGKPAEPLPFAFRRDLGTFVRLEGEGKAGMTQPVRFDINFRLPLNELLRYGAGIQQVLEQMQ